MTRQQHLDFCNKCVNRKFDSKLGIICSLTNNIADFEGNCENFKLDENVRPAVAGELSDTSDIVWGELDEVGLKKLRAHQDLNYAIAGGLVAALVSAVLWAVITVTTEHQIGYMAIGVGLIVGFAVRYFGAGVDKKFGFLGAALSLLGCMLGNLFSQIGFAAQEQAQSYFEIISILTPNMVFSVLAETFQAIDLLFYGLAVYEGYRFAFRPLSNDLINQLKSADFEGTPDNQKFRLPLVIAGIAIISVFVFSMTRGVNGHKIYNYESGMKQTEGELKNSKPDGKWISWHESGTIQSEGFFTEGVIDKSWKWFDENGNLSKTGQYAKGLETGVWKNFYPNGITLDSGNYIDGRKNGKWIINYENGRLYQSGSYNRDVQEGIWEVYYEDGKLVSKGLMKDNKPVGKWSNFYPSGQLANELENLPDDKILVWNSFDSAGKVLVQNGEGIYKEFSDKGKLLQTGKVEKGHKVGKWNVYYETGDLKAEGRYIDDFFLLDNSWDSNGRQNVKNGSGSFLSYYADGKSLSESGEYKNGYKTGTWQTFYETSDKVLQESHYEKGRLNGIMKQYFESGTVYAEGKMENNLMEGEWIWYHESGIEASKVSFKQDKKDGVQTMWNSEGEKQKEEYYENGNFVKVIVF